MKIKLKKTMAIILTVAMIAGLLAGLIALMPTTAYGLTYEEGDIWINTDGQQMSAEQASQWEYTLSGSDVDLTKYNGGGFIDGKVPATINGNPVTKMSSTFAMNSSIVVAPVIPNTVTEMYHTFYLCDYLTVPPVIPDSVTNMSGTFMSCSNLVNPPVIPYGVRIMTNTFAGCINLETAPEIPDSVIVMGSIFSNCFKLVNAPVIPDGVGNMESAFINNSKLTGNVLIPSSVSNLSHIFNGTVQPITMYYYPDNTAAHIVNVPSNVTKVMIGSVENHPNGGDAVIKKDTVIYAPSPNASDEYLHDKSNNYMKVGESIQLDVININPEIEYKLVTKSNNDEPSIIIDQEGLMVGINEGVSLITLLETEDESKVLDSMVMYVGFGDEITPEEQDILDTSSDDPNDYGYITEIGDPTGTVYINYYDNFSNWIGNDVYTDVKGTQTFYAPDIKGYIKPDEDFQIITVVEGQKEYFIDFYYTKPTIGVLNIHYEDTKGNTIRDTDTHYNVTGSYNYYYPQHIEGYNNPTPPNDMLYLDVTESMDEYNFTFVYTERLVGNMTIHYQDTSGNTIKDSETSVIYDHGWAEAPYIEGYTRPNKSNRHINFTVIEGQTEYTHTFIYSIGAEVPMGNVSIQYYDDYGGLVKNGDFYENVTGTRTFYAPDVPGYTKTEESVTLTMIGGQDHYNHTFYYTKEWVDPMAPQGTVNIKYEHVDGYELKQQDTYFGISGSKIFYAPEIGDFTKPVEDSTVINIVEGVWEYNHTFTYSGGTAPEGTVIINYFDGEWNRVRDSVTYNNVSGTQTYYAPDIVGYIKPAIDFKTVTIGGFPSQYYIDFIYTVDEDYTGGGDEGGTGGDNPIDEGMASEDSNLQIIGLVESITTLDVDVPLSINFVIDAERNFIKPNDLKIVSNCPAPLKVSIYEVDKKTDAPNIVKENTYTDSEWNNLNRKQTSENIALSLNNINLSTTNVELGNLKSAFRETQELDIDLTSKYGKAWANKEEINFSYSIVFLIEMQ